MLESLHWDRGLKSPEAHQQFDELRSDALRLFTIVATVGYLIWHFTNSVLGASDRQTDSSYLVAIVAVPTLVMTWLLVSRARRLAVAVFLVGGLGATVWGIYITDDPRLAMCLAMLTLVAGFVASPLVGLGYGIGGTALLYLMRSFRPGVLSPADLGEVVVFSLLATIGVWVLTYHLLLTLNWYAESYARADLHIREARDHRAQLVQAWKQLDEAYHRLERANAALHLAWQAAEAAERSKLEFAANVSHEFRTPLNLIVGYSEMVMTSPESYRGVALPAEYRGDLAAIYRAAQHILSLTDDVLDLARLEVGHLGLSREPTDLLQTVQEAITLVRDYVEAKRLELRVTVPSELPMLLVDRLRIRQVMLNLLTNASRFTERGYIEVRVEARPDDVRISVKDTGTGLSAEGRANLFERFAGKGDKQATSAESVGLGLPISKHIVELHGGEMSVESEAGVGTTFAFTLPLALLDGQAVAPALGSLDPIYRRGSEQVVMLVHPDQDVGNLFRRHLEGFEVRPAASLAEATARALESKATAIVAATDGVADWEAGSIPIIRCQIPDRSSLSRHLNVAAYLVKPVSRETLIQTTEQLNGPVERVLIADDDIRFTRLLTRMLATGNQRYQVTTAHNGNEALAKLRAERPDLLLLDLAMPGLDGFGVLEAIAEDPTLRGVQVIVVSAADTAGAASAIGSEVVIHKPGGFEPVELIQVIGAAISKLSLARSVPRDTAATRAGDPPD